MTEHDVRVGTLFWAPQSDALLLVLSDKPVSVVLFPTTGRLVWGIDRSLMSLASGWMRAGWKIIA